MLKHAAILLMSVLPLAACNSSPTVEAKNASVAEVAEKVEKAGGTDSFLRPGKWLTKATLEYDAEAQELISRPAKLAYPIRDGIPIMLPEEARKIE